MKAKKLNLFGFILLISFCLFKCSSDDGNPSIIIDEPNAGLIKNIELFQLNYRYDFYYSENNLLSYWTGNTSNSNGNNTKDSLIYDQNNRISQWNHSQTSGIINPLTERNYHYDSENRLLRYTDINTDVNLEYINDSIIVSGYTHDYDIDILILVTNSNGLVEKMIESNRYTDFHYGINNNLIRVENYIYDNQGNPPDTPGRSWDLYYDSKNNPFYNQMNSIYIERFITRYYRKDTAVDAYFGVTYFNFPYFMNNVIAVENAVQNYNFLYSFEYNENDYPISIFDEILTNYNETYLIEYY